MPNYVPGVGNPKAKLLILGEAPGKAEDEAREPFVGPSGEFLWEILNSLGVNRNEVWTTNVFKYRPPNNQIKRIGEVCNPIEEIEKLWSEIRDVNPNCILALGGTAFQAIRGHGGILKWRGSILMSKFNDMKLVGTLHPANIIRSAQSEYGPASTSNYKIFKYIYKQIFTLDVKRAIEESKYPELRLEPRYVTICRDSMQLRRYLDQNKNLSKMSTDIESINCIPVCVGISFNKHESLVIPLFNSLGTNVIGGIPRSDQVFMWQQLDELFKEKDIIGQNFKYDQEKLEMIGFTFRKGPLPIYSDTLLKAHTINPELPSKKMEMLQSIWTKLPYHKDEGKGFNPKKDKIDKFFHYCGLDTMSTYETDESMDEDLQDMSDKYHRDMNKFFFSYVMRLHKVYMDMERIGFNVDYVAKEFLKLKYQDRHDLIAMRLNDALPDFEVSGKKCHKEHKVNVAAHQQIKKLLFGYLKLPDRRKHGKTSSDEGTIVSLLNNVVKDETRRSILFDISEDRRVRKTLGTYILTKADYDGRIRGSYRITGTETGRSSTSILSPPIRPVKSGHAFQTLTKHGDIGADIRLLYIPDDGFIFVQIDLSQAEPRIVSVLSEDFELQEAFKSGKVDIHRRTAALVLGMTSDLDLSEIYNEVADTIGKDSGERFLGKKSRNGGNYDMGAGELASNIAEDAKRFNINVSVSEWRASKMLENFHRCSPKIKSVFHKDVQDAINSTRVLINPYGRIRTFYERLEKKTYGEGYATLPQSTVADTVKNAIIDAREHEMLDFHKMLMGEAHDSLLMRFPKGEWEDRARVVKKLLERPIDFNQCSLRRDVKLSIPADVEIGEKNYRDLVKVKI